MTSTEPLVQHFLSLDPIEPPDMHYVQPENQGSVFHEEGRILCKLARFVERSVFFAPLTDFDEPGVHVLEIGSAVGISSRYILHGLKQPHSTLTSIDILHRWSTNYPNHTQLSGYSTDYFPLERGKYAFAFVDGDHRYDGARADTLACIEAGIPVIAHHDTNEANIPRANNTSMDGSDDAQVMDDLIKEGLTRGYKHYRVLTHCGIDIISKIPL